MRLWMVLCLIGLAAAAAAPVNGSESTELGDGAGEKSTTSNVSKSIAFSGQQTFRLPFKTILREPLVNGHTVHAFGTISSNATEIEVAFLKGSDKEADMPLHLSIRFDEGIFICNTFVNGTWREDEKRINNTFEAGREFDLRIRIIDNKFHVFANRKDIGQFDIRQSLDGVDHASIRGDLDSLNLFHYGGQVYPDHYAAHANLVPGKRLDISGVPIGGRVNRFDVNLYGENDEITFKLAFRFYDKVISRNAQVNEVLGKEEIPGEFPLIEGDVFDLTLLNEASAIQFYVNGKLFSTLKHIGKSNNYKKLNVEGQVELHSVTVNDVVKA